MKINRHLIILLLIILVAGATYALPRVKYKSPDILSKLEIPYRTPDWLGKNMSSKLNLNDLRYNFVSQVFVREYINYYGENLLWFILDAGNFHNPKVCYSSAGFKIKDLPDTEFKIENHTFKATTAYFENKGEGFVIIYWICIDKKLSDWTRQKFIQFWYSLFNKEKIGFMVRLDIPATPETTNSAIKLAKEFIASISPKISPEQAKYIFGE